MIRKYNVDDSFFRIIDSEEKAYLLGFFLADGTYKLGARCTESYMFQVALQEKDKEIIDYFKKYIVPDKPLRYTEPRIDKNNVSHQGVYHISWTSSIMNKDLESYNIYPRKTYDVNFEFPFEVIPREFIWDFIRGFFDGDGQISYSDKTHYSTLALYGTSYKFMNDLGDLFEKEFEVHKRVEGVKKSNMILYTLRFNANFHKLKFYEALYYKFYENKNLFLKRKQEKFLNYLLFKYRDNQSDCERLIDIVERRE